MSHHPAWRARRATAVISATAFAGIAGGLAATHVGAAASHPRPSTTPTTVAPSGQVDDGTDDGIPSGEGWSASPGNPSGQSQAPSDGAPIDDHGQSGAS